MISTGILCAAGVGILYIDGSSHEAALPALFLNIYSLPLRQASNSGKQAGNVEVQREEKQAQTQTVAVSQQGSLRYNDSSTISCHPKAMVLTPNQTRLVVSHVNAEQGSSKPPPAIS